MEFSILTLFPDALSPYLDSSILGRAQTRGLIKINVVDIRNYAAGRHRVADDQPYGGGPGMILKPEPLVKAARAAKTPNSRTLLLSPQGKTLNQAGILKLSQIPHLILLCGHYRGVDERVLDLVVDEEISIGDYVLSGGEAAAMVVTDAVARMVPGVVADPDSVTADSFMDGLLDHAHYTRPADFEGIQVPEVLRSGNHREIKAFRQQQRIERTRAKRPDLAERLGS